MQPLLVPQRVVSTIAIAWQADSSSLALEETIDEESSEIPISVFEALELNTKSNDEKHARKENNTKAVPHLTITPTIS